VIRVVLVAVAGVAVIVGAGAYAWHRAPSAQPQAFFCSKENSPVADNKTEQKARLTKEQYCILYDKGTEAPFTGKYWDNHEPGVYKCAGCGQPLFKSDTKYDSGTGWPSFFEPIPGAISGVEDKSYGMVRTEVVCNRCGGHIGHVFDDGPKPTGLRFCTNSGALDFVPNEEQG
jgi:peptide-methionine (R)-S-oxide reductase